jgi:small-conductance mechanosensitive channel
MPDYIEDILKEKFFDNTVSDYLITIGIFVGAVIVLRLLENFFIRRVKGWADRTSTKVDDIFIRIVETNLVPLLYVLAFYLSVQFLTLHDMAERIVTFLIVIAMTVQVARLVVSVLVLYLNNYLQKDRERLRVSSHIGTFIKIAVWSVAVIFALDNLGFDVNAVIAGLGVGGVAVAFAAQAILGDLFNYFVIFFDKPFKTGDFIIVDDLMGVVEHIGIKTTRVVSLGGEQLVFSNTDLTSTRVRNYKRMAQRRVLFVLGVTYQTSHAMMKKIPDMVKGIIEKIPHTTFDRAHFKNFGDFSLNIEVVYYVVGSDYNAYMDIQQKINFEIMKRFEDEGIEFAYPTQTLFVSKEQASPSQKS